MTDVLPPCSSSSLLLFLSSSRGAWLRAELPCAGLPLLRASVRPRDRRGAVRGQRDGAVCGGKVCGKATPPAAPGGSGSKSDPCLTCLAPCFTQGGGTLLRAPCCTQSQVSGVTLVLSITVPSCGYTENHQVAAVHQRSSAVLNRRETKKAWYPCQGNVGYFSLIRI